MDTAMSDSLLRKQQSSNADEHLFYHADVLEWTDTIIQQDREKVGLDGAWTIEVQVVCAHDMPLQESRIVCDASKRYAFLQMRCDHSKEMLLWLTIHELYELFLYETGDIFFDTISLTEIPIQLRTRLDQEYRAARDRQIEVLVAKHLQRRRPGLLLALLSLEPEHGTVVKEAVVITGEETVMGERVYGA